MQALWPIIICFVAVIASSMAQSETMNSPVESLPQWKFIPTVLELQTGKL